MTAVEMYNEFRTGYDEVTSFSAPSLDHYDISIFLTRAQESILKRRVHAEGNKYGESFDSSEKRKRDFDELLRTVDISTPSSSQTGTVPFSRFFDLPLDHMLTVMERADISLIFPDACYPTGMIRNVRVKPITYDTYMMNKDNPFKKPHKQLVWRLVHSRNSTTSTLSSSNKKRQLLISDGTYNITNYFVTYLSKPKPIITGTLAGTLTIEGLSTQTDCELDPMIHREIITEAIRIASASLRDPGYQIDMAESQLSE